MIKKLFNCLSLALFACTICQCQTKKYPPGYDFELFKATPVYDLADAVERQDTQSIVEIVSKKPKTIDFKERKFGHTLLFLAVANDKELSAEKLLNLGADANAEDFDGRSPLIEVCAFSDHFKNPYEMARLLISHKANVNYLQIDTTFDQFGKRKDFSTTPLRASCIYGTLEMVKLLVDSGADLGSGINENSILSLAVLTGKLELVKYFLIEKKVPIPEYVVIRQPGNKHEKKMTISDILNENNFSKNENQDALKKQIIDYLKSKGTK